MGGRNPGRRDIPKLVAGQLAPRIATDIPTYPANLCPPWRYVVNEVRRLADDYDDYLVAR